MNIPYSEHENITRIIERDTKFLEKYNIMDYSLLFGIAHRRRDSIFENLLDNGRISFTKKKDFAYFMSIIDIFQKYTIKKRMEHSLKSLKLSAKESRMISCIPPKPYSDRFNNFVKTYILNKN